MVTVSQSKAKTFRQCRQSYHYKYTLNLKRKKIRRPFQFGRIIHSMIEADANADDPFEMLDQINVENANMFRAEKEEYGNLIEDIRTIMTEYFEYWSESPIKYDRVGGRSAEHPFEIELEPGIYFKGVIDGKGRVNGLRWLVEHKSFSRMPNEDQRWRNVQSCVYIRANDILGWKPLDGTCWDYIRSKAPSVPQLLKSGALSEKAIDTLPSVVKNTIHEHGLSEEDYTDLIAKAEANRSSYFIRTFTPTSREVVDRVFNDFVATAREIAEGRYKPVRNIGQHCDFCDYEAICRAELQGSDVDYVISREYKKDEGASSETVTHKATYKECQGGE
jgi:PD-(D/E)XK nuclease superfamily